MKLLKTTRLKLVVLALLSAVGAMFGWANPAIAQAACVATAAQTMNCTTVACTAQMCWATADASLTGCKAYITGPGGAMPALSGTMTVPGLNCEVAMPKLVTTGVYSIRGTAVNAFGESPQGSPLALTTGTPGAAPSGLAVK